jgi:Ca-activated chloride channel family protein
MIVFAYEKMAILLVLPFVIRLLLPAFKAWQGDALRVPFVADFEAIDKQTGAKMQSLNGRKFSPMFWIFCAVWALLTVAAMRPIQIGEPIRIESEGRDILLVTDISTSMRETDFVYQGNRLDRLTAVKAVVSKFVDGRTADRLGLILFGTRAYLQAPLTYDRKTLNEVLWATSAGMAGDSTSIGDALGLAVKTLEQGSGSLDQKVIILLTDGENNDGTLSLPQALDLAKKEGIKVYTIGVGQGRQSLMNSFFGVKQQAPYSQDLSRLADETGGRYYQADDLNGLANIYREIDRLEPQRSEQNLIYPRKELFYFPLLAALALAVLGMMYFRRLG